jgi:regulatory protein
MINNTIKQDRQRSSPTKTKRTAKKITVSYLHNSGLFYLQRFASSRNNFISVMDRKIRKSCRDHPDQDYTACRAMLETLTETFERCGLLNDTLYVNSLIQSLQQRGLSRSGTISKLIQKGIPKDMALNALQQTDEPVHAEIDSAFIFARRKKLGPFATKPEKQNGKKAFAAFARAGYSYETARTVLNTEHDAGIKHSTQSAQSTIE